MVADGGVALAHVLAGAAQGDAVVDQAVVPDLGGLADDDAHAVVDDQALADGGAGVNFDSGAPAAGLGDPAGEQLQVVLIAPVGPAVAAGGFQSGIEQQHLQRSTGGGVAGFIGFDGFAQVFEHGFPLSFFVYQSMREGIHRRSVMAKLLRYV